MPFETSSVCQRCQCTDILDNVFDLGLYHLSSYYFLFDSYIGCVSGRRMVNRSRIDKRGFDFCVVWFCSYSNYLYCHYVFFGFGHSLYADDNVFRSDR